jgi:MFS transporter, DHA1 family, inner membrane transport protein
MRQEILNTQGIGRVAAQDLSGWDIAKLGVTYALATNGVTLAPITVSVVIERLGVTEAQATTIAGVELLGLVISCLIFPYFAGTFGRQMVWIGGCGAVLMHVLSGLAGSGEELSVARGLAGIFEGMLFVCVAAAIAHRPSAERIWGFVILLAGVLNSSLLLGLSSVEIETLTYWVFPIIGGFTVVGLPFAFAISKPIERNRSVVQIKSIPWLTIGMLWVFLFTVTAIQAAQWAVASVLGKQIGLSMVTVGLLLAVSSLLGFFGSAVPAVSKLFVHRVKIILFSVALMAVTVWWFVNSSGPSSYFTSQLLLNLAFYAVLPYLNGYLSELDSRGALVSFTFVIVLLGAAIGTAVAGELLTTAGLHNFGLTLGFGMLPCAVLAMLVFRGDHAKQRA